MKRIYRSGRDNSNVTRYIIAISQLLILETALESGFLSFVYDLNCPKAANGSGFNEALSWVASGEVRKLR